MKPLLIITAALLVSTSAFPQPTVSIPGLAVTATFVEDVETGWNLSFLGHSSEPAQAAVPLHNASANEPLWSIAAYDGTAIPLTLNPLTFLPADLVSTSTNLMGSVLELNWHYAPAVGPVADLQITILVGGLPGGMELYWMVMTTLTPRAGHQLSVERIDAPRIAIGARGQDMNDKLYIPAQSGTVISNFSDPSFVFNNGRVVYEPSPLTISHQQWGVWHVDPSPAYPGLTLNHVLPDSQMLSMGTRDSMGIAKTYFAENRLDASTGTRYLLWEVGHLPEDNRTVSSATQNYQSFSPITGYGYLVATGAHTTGSHWPDLAAHYRAWALGATWNYEGEPAQRKARIIEPNSDFSNEVRFASMLLTYNTPLFLGTCQSSFFRTAFEDIEAWQDLYITRLGMPPSASKILTLHYGHINETELTREGLDKFLDLGNPFQLTPYSSAPWVSEMSRVGSLSNVSVGVHTYGEGWDRTMPSWAGLPNVPPVPTPPCVAAGISVPCGPPAACIGPQTPTPPIPQLRFSYQLAPVGSGGQDVMFCGSCEDVVAMCPDSSHGYKDAHLAALYLYSALLRQQIGATGAVLGGYYLDNMGSPGIPLCYYQPLTNEPDDVMHDHASLGGGRYWIAGRRALSRRCRDAVRADINPGQWTMLENPSEHWVGAGDIVGAYQRERFSYFGSHEVPGLIRAPWALSFPFAPEHESVSVPGFETIYGDCIYSAEWQNTAYDAATHTALPLPPNFPPNLLPPMTPAGPHPGVPEFNALCAYNAYAYQGLGFTQISDCPSVSEAGVGAALIFFQGGFRQIQTRPTPAERWEDFLWWTASYAYLRDAIGFHFKQQLMSVNFRGQTPLYPDHLNPDPNLGALVKDGIPHRFLMAMQKVRGDWRDWYCLGPRLGQPIAEPSAFHAFAARVARETVDVSFVSCHAHHTIPSNAIILVTNWMPYPVTFDIHYSPLASGFLALGPSTITEHTPDLGGGSPPPLPLVGGASPIPGRLQFTTSTIPGGQLRIYHLQ
jgi:hypothetical protein